MNTPIIDPMIFYWMNVLEHIQHLPEMLLLILLLFGLGSMLFEMDLDYEEKASFRKFYKKMLKILFYVMCASFLLSLFIPSKETMLNMLIADQLTPANIHLIGDNLKDAVIFIAEQAIKVGEALK